MTLLDKIDTILNCLYTHSGENPDFAKIQKWLSDKPEIEKGDIEDCLLHLHRNKYIYCEFMGNRDYIYIDSPQAHYLISFEGKVFIESGGYQQKATDAASENTRVDAVEAFQHAQAWRLNRLTAWIAGGTIALAVIELWKMALEYHWFNRCH